MNLKIHFFLKNWPLCFLLNTQQIQAVSFSVDKHSLGTPPFVPTIAPPPVQNHLFNTTVSGTVELDMLDITLKLDEKENLDALSIEHSSETWAGVIFSVDNEAMGISASAVDIQTPAGNDLFFSPLATGSNFLYRSAHQHGLINRRDELDAIEVLSWEKPQQKLETYSGQLYFSVAGRATIEVLSLETGLRQVFKTAKEMGLKSQQGNQDDIDALVVFAQGKKALFSLAPGSPHLSQIPPAGEPPYSPADIFLTTFQGDYQRVLTAETLGLRVRDNVDALNSVEDADLAQLADLVNLVMTTENRHVVLRWRTAVARARAGFNLWRAQRKSGKKCHNIDADDYIVTKLVFQATKGKIIAEDTYSYEDTTVIPGNTYCYLLQDIHADTISPEQRAFIRIITVEK